MISQSARGKERHRKPNKMNEKKGLGNQRLDMGFWGGKTPGGGGGAGREAAGGESGQRG